MVKSSDSIVASDAQATTETLVTVPLIHIPLGRSNTSPGGNNNHEHTTYDKMNVIVKAAANAAAKEQQGGQQGFQQGSKEEVSLTSCSFASSPSSSSHGVPKTKFDVMCDVASAHRATATLSAKAEDGCVPPSKASTKPKSSLFSPMKMETPVMRDFSSSQASEFVPTVVHKPVVYYPKYNTQHDTSAMRSSPPVLHFHPPTQQAANVSGPRQPSTTPLPQLVPTFMPMPSMMMMMMMPQQHPMASPVNTASPPSFALPTHQQQMPILSAYPQVMFPPVGWMSVPSAEPAGGQESQLQQMMAHQASPMNHPSYQHAIQFQQQSLQSFPAGNSAFTPSRSVAQHIVASRKSAARPNTTSPPRKSSPCAHTGSSEKKIRFTPPTIVHQPDESCQKKSKHQIKKQSEHK